DNVLEDRRGDRARGNGVDLDVVLRHFAGQRLCQARNRGLAAGVGAAVRHTITGAAQVDDLPVARLDHAGDNGATVKERPVKVDVDRLQPDLRVQLPDGADGRDDAGVVDHDIDPAVLRQRHGNDVLDV